jgi:hypothetical protein
VSDDRNDTRLSPKTRAQSRSKTPFWLNLIGTIL